VTRSSPKHSLPAIIPLRFATVAAATLILAISSAPVQSANYFKCVRPDGSVIFSDTECPTETEVLTEKTLKAGSLTGHIGQGPYSDGQDNISLADMLKLRTQLTEVLTALAPIKTASTEYHLSQNAWPPYLETLGFDPARMNNAHIKTVLLSRSGSIIARLREEFGDGKMVVLTPHEAMDGTQVEWDCAANFSPLIMNELSCDSRKIHE